MTTYRNIHGRSIQAVTTDPSESVAEGQVWYNTTSDTFKSVVALEAWSSTSNMINKVTQGEAGTDGPRDAFAIWGGRTIPAVTTNLTEEYNGSGWSAGGNLGTAARKREGGGTLSAAWCANGEDSSPTSYISNVEEYNGTSWSEETNTPAASSLIGGSGPQTAGIATLGQLAPGPYPKATLEYDGSSWTSGGTMSVSRTSSSAGQVGPQTAAIITGGEPTPIANTESYDGTSWSEVGDLVTALGQCSDGTFGDQTAAVQCGGKTSPSPGAGVTTSQTWNGTSWSSGTAMGQARKSHSTSGTSTQGLACSGQTSTTPSALTSAEEYNKSANVITAAAWASGGAMSAGRYGGANAGTKNAALYATGYNNSTTTYTNATEEYDGSSWSGGGNINVLGQSTGSSGTQTACWAAGRGPNNPPGQGPPVSTEEYDGSSWTSGGNMNTATAGPGGCGTQTAVSFARGSQDHEYYDGSSWTAQTDSPSPARGGGVQAGTQTANIYFGAEVPGGTYVNTTFEWDGSSWTSGGTMVFAQAGAAGGIGTQTAAMQAQGYSPATSPNRMAQTSAYDGTSWSTRPSLSTGRSNGGNSTASPNSDAVTFTGTTGSPVTNTEEFTGETSTANIEDFSTS